MSAIPTVTALRFTGSADRELLPLLVLGPSLGTSAATLWRGCAAHLTDAFDEDIFVVTEHGWASLLSSAAGHLPCLTTVA